jgi:6-phosphogluconolactonase (cycloisomerase 2 family)
MALLALAISVALVGSGTDSRPVWPASSAPRLVSVEPMAEMQGEMCQWMQASTTAQRQLTGAELILAALQSRPGAAQAPAAAQGRNLVRDRSPLRVIKDPYPTYSAVALDLQHGEIVLQDENLFQIMVYDRTANTPPTATMTEPKRVIGGHETKIEFNCGLYIDPKTGDIYSVNNDTLNTMTVFSREAKGNVHPTRELHSPHRSYGIAVDEAAEELFMTRQDPAEVYVYRKYAEGDEQPKRILRGNKTLLSDVHGIALDTKNGWMFVANYGNGGTYREGPNGEVGGKIPGSGKFTPPNITAYPIKAQGDTAPIRVIEGDKTQFNWPAHLSIDEERGEIYVANDGGHSVLVFKVTDNGNVAPTRVIKGPKSQIKNPTGIFVDTKNDEIVVANMGNHMATVFARTANGDVAPLRTIRGAPLDTPALQIGNPGAVAYDTKRNEILVPN